MCIIDKAYHAAAAAAQPRAQSRFTLRPFQAGQAMTFPIDTTLRGTFPPLHLDSKRFLRRALQCVNRFCANRFEWK